MSAAQRERRNFTKEFKDEVVEQVLRGSASVAELARKHKIRSNVLHRWRNEALARLRQTSGEQAALKRKLRFLQAENEQFKAELEFFASTLSPKGGAERRQLVALARSKGVRMTVLARVLGVARTTLYR